MIVGCKYGTTSASASAAFLSGGIVPGTAGCMAAILAPFAALAAGLAAQCKPLLERNKKRVQARLTITQSKPPPPDAEQWRVVSYKLSGLDIAL